jgi:hypothetical protein
MYVKHLGADMKLHHARQLLDQLVTMQREYLLSDAIRLQSSRERSGTTTRWIRIAQPPPVEFAQVAGTAIRTIREALDDLAVSLAVASRRSPRNTTFPITPSAQAYDVEEAQCLRHANHAARQAVRSVTPWKGGDDKLWELHHLSATGDPPVIRIGQVVAVTPVSLPSVLQVLEPGVRTRGACVPLVDGSPIVVVQEAGEWEPANALEADVRLVLGSGDLLRGHPVDTSVERLIVHASGVVDQVVRAAEHH